jgi:hypothetical protein
VLQGGYIRRALAKVGSSALPVGKSGRRKVVNVVKAA